MYIESTSLYLKSEKLPFIKKCVFVIIVSVNSVYKYTELTLAGFRFEQISLDVSEVFFDEKQNSPHIKESQYYPMFTRYFKPMFNRCLTNNSCGSFY